MVYSIYAAHYHPASGHNPLWLIKTTRTAQSAVTDIPQLKEAQKPFIKFSHNLSHDVFYDSVAHKATVVV